MARWFPPVTGRCRRRARTTDLQVPIKVDTWLVLAVGRPLPGNRNDCTALVTRRPRTSHYETAPRACLVGLAGVGDDVGLWTG